MGHKDTRMLARVYTRLPPELLRQRLPAALGVCNAGAVNASGNGAQNGPNGQPGSDVTPRKMAPGAHQSRTPFLRWSEKQALARPVRERELCPVAIANSLCVNSG
jgi:hypothetical protein